jgi:hypothetical protein
MGLGGLGGSGGRGWPGVDEPAPSLLPARNPPRVWGTLAVEADTLVVRLEGWRAIWAAKRTLRVPLQALVAVRHDPGVYANITTRLRGNRRSHTSMFKLGAYPSAAGWSFWSCGMARNAVVLETVGLRYRFIVIEVADPQSVVATVGRAAGIEAPKPPERATPRPKTVPQRFAEQKTQPRTQRPGVAPRRPATNDKRGTTSDKRGTTSDKRDES